MTGGTGRQLPDRTDEFDDDMDDILDGDGFDGDTVGYGFPDVPGAPAAPPAVTACWSCEAERPDDLRDCPVCLSPATHLVLSLRTPALRLTAAPGRPLHLGRDPGWAAPRAAAALVGSPGVSRRHAILTVAEDGTAWAAEASADGSLNGLWLNGDRLAPASRHRLRDGDRIGLGRTVTGTVRLHPPH